MRSFIIAIFIFAISLVSVIADAQKAGDPGAYIAKVTESQKQINFEMLGYVSAMAHDKSA